MNDRLDGWKAVAGHVRKSVRTAQRWERELGLPVHRMQTETGEIVYGLVSEIEAWVQDRVRGPGESRTPSATASSSGPIVLPQVDQGFTEPAAVAPQIALPVVVPVAAGRTVLPWFAGGSILLAGTLLGWLLARLNLPL